MPSPAHASRRPPWGRLRPLARRVRSSRCEGPGPRVGFTLLELTLVLALMALLASLGAPVWRSSLDRWAVRSVRDRTAVALHRARAEARRWGGARLEVDAAEGRLRLHRTSSDSVVWEDGSAREHRVQVILPRGRTGTSLTFDALGLGVVASRTLVF